MMQRITQWGVSINTLDDIPSLRKSVGIYPGNAKESKITYITNFGIHNIFDFDKIADFVIESKVSVWQIQLTMGKGMLSASGIAHLRKLINERFPHPDKYSPIIETGTVQIQLADNLQYVHDCMAGIKTCSITYDGNVINCLSERAWSDSLSVQSNLEYTTLEHIWEEMFYHKRFDCSKCCRDCIQYPEIEPESKNLIGDIMNPYRVPSGSVYVPPKQPATYVYDVAEPYPKITITVYDVGERFTNPIFYGNTTYTDVSINELKSHISTTTDKTTSSSVDISKIKAQSSFTDDTVENSQDEK
jgi:hypothetical protein